MKVTRGRSRCGSRLALILLLLGWPSFSDAQEKKGVNLTDLIEETQWLTSNPEKNTLLWWMPPEYWKLVFAQNSPSPSELEESMKLIRPYIIVGTADGTIGDDGGASYRSNSELRNDIWIKDHRGDYYSPLEDSEVNPDARNLVTMIGATLSNTFGEMGKNMHFFLFPLENENGERIVDAQKEGSFVIQIGEEEVTWRLPLGALLPAKACPKCKEELSGAFNFCPWDGSKL